MKKFSIILVGLLTTGTFQFAQEETKAEKIRPSPMSYEQRVERGFGQLFEPLWAGDRPGWLRREESDRQTQKVEITIIHRGPMNRGEFRQGLQRSKGPMMNRRGMRLCQQCQEQIQPKCFYNDDRPRRQQNRQQNRQHRGGRQ